MMSCGGFALFSTAVIVSFFLSDFQAGNYTSLIFFLAGMLLLTERSDSGFWHDSSFSQRFFCVDK